MYKSTVARFLRYIRARAWLYYRYFVYLCKNQCFK
nr:MAG TPA: CRAL/TRIO, N-terminal domain [Caudoviricetes sp.]DAZ74770.1 MAG TPA: CRAL/TRIO, N-terminal domain [Caudoviricetes sp.]